MSRHYDILVIGAGIHGAGVAQAAAAAGYSVLVLEQDCVAAGTSSRSSKLIHGGLRYLEHGELALVWECLRERQLLLRLAPELVRLVPFRIPVYRDTRRRPWQIRAGLSLYALLGGMRDGMGFRSLPRRVWDQLAGLRTEGLQAIFEYWDGQTDDAALTRAVMNSACRLGAELRAPARLLHAAVHPQGLEVSYRDAGREHSGSCAVLVNCSGPWIEEVTALIHPAGAIPAVDLVQGTHVILAAPASDAIYYLEVPEDGRAVFTIPWRGKTMVGTTESPFAGRDPSAVAPLPAERDYLQRAVSHYFPRLPWEEVDAFAGLRVLPHSADRPFDRGRELMVSQDHRSIPRVLGVYGGKLTSYRADAQKILQRARPSLPARTARADTRQLTLVPAD